jgi:predicted membrane protein
MNNEEKKAFITKNLVFWIATSAVIGAAVNLFVLRKMKEN